MLQQGTKVRGSIGGHQFTGYIAHYMPWTGIKLDQPITGNGDYKESLYISVADSVKAMPVNACRVVSDRNKQDWIEQIPDRPGSECEPLPLSDIARQTFTAELKHITPENYRKQYESAHTTYRTVKRKVTCEYGHTHMVDTREPIKPTIDANRLNLAYFWHCLAEYARYQDQCEYTARLERWHHLAGKLALAGGHINYGGDYGDLPHDTVCKIKDELSKQYWALCADYKAKIFGPYLDRYNRHHR